MCLAVCTCIARSLKTDAVICTCVPITVIGRQGEMINRLQAESGARIQVAPGELEDLSYNLDIALAIQHAVHLQS